MYCEGIIMSLLNIQYQKRDLDYTDYDMQGVRMPSGDFIYFRDLEKDFSFDDDLENTFSIIGPAFSLGCYTNDTFGKLIERRTGLKQVNLSLQGSSPETYLRSDLEKIIQVINKTKFCIITAFSGRSVSNSQFEHSDLLYTYEKLRTKDNTQLRPAHSLYQEYLESHGKEGLEDLIRETQDNFVNTSNELFEAIKTKKIFFWFSKRSPSQYDLASSMGHDDIFKIMGKFPHFIDQGVVNEIKKTTDYYVESVDASGTPQLLFNRWDGEVQAVKKDSAYGYTSSRFNLYYASPLMHLNAFNNLMPAISSVLGGNIDSSNHPISNKLFQERTVDMADALHLGKFLRLNKPLNVHIDEFWFNTLGKHYENKKEEKAPYLPESIKRVRNGGVRGSTTNDLDFCLSIDSSDVDNSDVFAFLLSKSLPFHDYRKYRNMITNSDERLNFVVLTTPRSGSTMLGSMLTNCGLGKVKEHFRNSISFLLNNKSSFNVAPDLLVDRLIEYGSMRNNVLDKSVFGTKFIAHFIENIEDEACIYKAFKYQKSKFIRLVREDKAAQVASVLRARVLNVWHKYKADNVTVNEDEILSKITKTEVVDVYKNLLEQEDYLNRICEEHDLNTCNVTYENLLSDRVAELSSIIRFLSPELGQNELDSFVQNSIPSTQKISESRDTSKLYGYVKTIIEQECVAREHSRHSEKMSA